MPVMIGLESLVRLANSRPIWPKEFESLIVSIEAMPKERTHWVAAADWCKENEEPELEIGFRFVANRPRIEIEQRDQESHEWFFRGLPNVLDGIYPGGLFDETTIAGLVARLTRKILLAQKELE